MSVEIHDGVHKLYAVVAVDGNERVGNFQCLLAIELITLYACFQIERVGQIIMLNVASCC